MITHPYLLPLPDITLDLRNLSVPWTLHCWMHTLATAHEHRYETIIDQLLQDFLQVWPDDYSAQFVDECLPLLFTIFRYSKVSICSYKLYNYSLTKNLVHLEVIMHDTLLLGTHENKLSHVAVMAGNLEHYRLHTFLTFFLS